MPEGKPTYILGVDRSSGESKTVIVVIPAHDMLDVSKEIEMTRRRIADALRVPVALMDPKVLRICKHPAFQSEVWATPYKDPDE